MSPRYYSRPSAFGGDPRIGLMPKTQRRRQEMLELLRRQINAQARRTARFGRSIQQTRYKS